MSSRPSSPDLFLLFNHRLTAAQEADARVSLGIGRIIAPSEALQRRWSEVPPETDELAAWLVPLFAWLVQAGRPGDLILIQGEFGATFLAVQEAFRLGLIPVYSTTRRQAVEEYQADGSVHLRHVFFHVRYRRYSLIGGAWFRRERR